MIPIVSEVVHISSARRLTITLTDLPSLSVCIEAISMTAKRGKVLASH